MCVRFNQLPKPEIYRFIRNIAEKENIDITPEEIETIQTNYNSDIRSMINFIQLHTSTNQEQPSHLPFVSNPNTLDDSNDPGRVCRPRNLTEKTNTLHIIRSDHWIKIHQLLLPTTSRTLSSKENAVFDTVELYIHKLSIQYNMDKRNILNMYFNYVIRHFPEVVSAEFLSIVEHATHDTEYIPIKHVLEYVCANLTEYYSKLAANTSRT